MAEGVDGPDQQQDRGPAGPQPAPAAAGRGLSIKVMQLKQLQSSQRVCDAGEASPWHQNGVSCWWCHVVSVFSLQSPACGRGLSSWPSSSSSSSSQSGSSSAVSTPSPVARVRSNCKRSSSNAGGSSATGRTSRHRAGPEEVGS